MRYAICEYDCDSGKTAWWSSLYVQNDPFIEGAKIKFLKFYAEIH